MQERIKDILNQAKAEIDLARDEQALFETEKKYLGRKGLLQDFFEELKDLSVEDKKQFGPMLNSAKQELTDQVAEKRGSFNQGSGESIDVTLLKAQEKGGTLHPVTIVLQDLYDIFTSMGFTYFDAPLVDTDYFNFQALNIPESHPARDMTDTFYLMGLGSESGDKNAGKNDEMARVLRTHASNTQNRILKSHAKNPGLPIRRFYHGKVFRNEATDASHDYEFYQFEVMMVDKNVSLANLKFVTQSFLRALFKREVKTRFRPGYFPFVEPGLELDFSCLVCDGVGCRVCKHSGWIEFMGCGMVHPEVLREGGLDPAEYTGFAFGLGLTRLVMMRYKIDDIRLLHSADLRFLEQF